MCRRWAQSAQIMCNISEVHQYYEQQSLFSFFRRMQSILICTLCSQLTKQDIHKIFTHNTRSIWPLETRMLCTQQECAFEKSCNKSLQWYTSDYLAEACKRCLHLLEISINNQQFTHILHQYQQQLCTHTLLWSADEEHQQIITNFSNIPASPQISAANISCSSWIIRITAQASQRFATIYRPSKATTNISRIIPTSAHTFCNNNYCCRGISANITMHLSLRLETKKPHESSFASNKHTFKCLDLSLRLQSKKKQEEANNKKCSYHTIIILFQQIYLLFSHMFKNKISTQKKKRCMLACIVC